MEGGTPFDATHKYAAIWSLLTFVIDNISPSTTFTLTKRHKGCEKGPAKWQHQAEMLIKGNENLSGSFTLSLTILATN
jgi:hypothetical protein